MADTATPASSDLAEKLTKLFDSIRAPGGRRYPDDDVAGAIEAHGWPPISANYIYLLRTGRRDNPTKRTLEALAWFFSVPPTYFFDDELSRQISEELELLSVIREHSVRDLALRAAELKPRHRQTIINLVRELTTDGDEEP